MRRFADYCRRGDRVRTLALLVCLALLPPALAEAGTLDARGVLEWFVYLTPAGYAPNVNVALTQPNAASYGLDLSSELQWRRVVVFAEPLILFGRSGADGEPSYNGVPITFHLIYGVGLRLVRNTELRLAHGQWRDLEGPTTHAAMWNSVSIRFAPEGAAAGLPEKFVQLHVYPPRNEYDPAPAVPFEERVVVRYAIQASYQLPQREEARCFVFAKPFVLFGNGRPQLAYGWEASPLAAKVIIGVAARAGERIQLRLTRSEWIDLGGYRGARQLATALSLRYRW